MSLFLLKEILLELWILTSLTFLKKSLLYFCPPACVMNVFLCDGLFPQDTCSNRSHHKWQTSRKHTSSPAPTALLFVVFLQCPHHSLPSTFHCGCQPTSPLKLLLPKSPITSTLSSSLYLFLSPFLTFLSTELIYTFFYNHFICRHPAYHTFLVFLCIHCPSPVSFAAATRTKRSP